MDALTAAVLLVALSFGYRLLSSALLRKGDMRAGAKVGSSTFFIEVKDRKRISESAKRRDSLGTDIPPPAERG